MEPETTSLSALTEWVGRSETLEDIAGPTPIAALAATLDQASEVKKIGVPLPPLWHWVYFLPIHPQSEVGPDGHAKRGGFLPPVLLPRRMWAGGQLEFRAPIRIGDRMTRTSTIESITTKNGHSGHLIFIKIRHELRTNEMAEPALVEFQDIVYRDAQRSDDITPKLQKADSAATWQREVSPDEVLLFRYSAITFNLKFRAS